MFIMQNCQIKMVITIELQQGQSVLFGVTSHTVKANLRKAFIINCFVKCSFFLIFNHAKLLNLVDGPSHTVFNLELWPWHWNAFGQAYAVHIDSTYLTFVQLFVNPTRGSQNIERLRKGDGQTDGRTTKLKCLPITLQAKTINKTDQ